MQTIDNRKNNPSASSYTTKLMSGGIEAIGAKLNEETAELIEAAGESGDDARQHLVHEAADLFYHLMVLLGFCDVTLQDVESELARRFGTSGLDEKASRK